MTLGSIDPEEIDAIIFDFDGVILDNAHVKDEAFRALFADYPEHQQLITELHRRHLGVSRFVKFDWIYADILGKKLSSDERVALGKRFSELVLSDTLASPFVSGALELIRQLAGRLPLFVASGTPQAELEFIVASRDLTDLFQEVHGSPPAKERTVREILDRHGFEGHRVLLIGDGLSDLEAAQAGGCQFVGIGSPTSQDQSWPHGLTTLKSLHPLCKVFQER